MKQYVCDISGRVANATDDADNFDMPDGWVEVTVRRVLPNPQYAEAQAAYDEQRAAWIAAAQAGAAAQGAQIGIDEIEAAADVQVPMHDEDPTYLSVTVKHLHPEGATAVIEALDLDALPDGQ